MIAKSCRDTPRGTPQSKAPGFDMAAEVRGLLYLIKQRVKAPDKRRLAIGEPLPYSKG
jgi:hypothetical protein